jgi:hypothetical protein
MLLKSSYQIEIDEFCKSLMIEDYDIKSVTKGALTQARAKLNPWAFQRLSQVAVDTFYSHSKYSTWRGLRVLAVDGTKLKLPKSNDIAEEFGVHKVGRNAAAPVSMAMASMVYDVINDIPIDSHIGPWSMSETKFVYEQHMHVFKEGDLLLGDRNYPSMKLMLTLNQKGIQFCFRMKQNWWKPVDEFVASNKRQSVVKIEIPSKIRKELDLGEECLTMVVRFIRIKLDNGEIEILCTSLTNSRRYPYKEFEALYHLRWGVEEAYKLLKNRIEVESFTGKTARSIYQDYYAKVLMMTLCATVSYPIADKVKAEYNREKTGNKYDQQINRTYAQGTTKRNLIKLFFTRTISKIVDLMDIAIEKVREIIRPDRKIERKHRNKKLHHINYKPY